MDILDLNLTDIPEETVLPEGDYKLRIDADPEQKTAKSSGNEYLNVVLTPVEYPDAPVIYHILTLPNAAADERQNRGRLRRIKQFCDAFGVDYASGIDLSLFAGLEGWGYVVLEEDPEYGARNKVRRFLTGK